MKKLKKIASVALALVMAMALMVPAFATTGENTITIKDAYPGNTYNAYKILDVSLSADGSESYKIAEGWAEFFSTGKGAGSLEGVGTDKTDLTGNVTWVGAASDTDALATFAKDALAYAKQKGIEPAGTKASTALNPDKSNYNTKEEVNITVSGYGWYLVDTTNGSLCSLSVNAPNAEITEKNPAPSIKKEAPTLVGKQIGDTVPFTITVTAQKGAEKYVVHDKMGAGLSLNAGTIAVAGATKDTDYTVTTTGLTDGCTFEVSFTETYLNKITEQTNIVITYTATINANAVTEVIGNKAQLKYGDNQATPWDKVGEDPENPDKPTGVRKIDLVKTNSSNEVITGAEFELTRKDANNQDETVWFLKDGNTYTVCAVGTANAVKTIEAGNVKIQGLGHDTAYTLKETKAPAGYNELTETEEIKLTADSEATITLDNPETTDVNEAKVEGGLQVINYTGAELPSTGGMGTTLFYAIGGVLLAGSAILFVTKKRMGE